MTKTQKQLAEAFQHLQIMHIQFDDHDPNNDQVIEAERDYQTLLHKRQAEQRKQAQQAEA